MANPATTKGPVERAVRIVTRATISDEALLQERQDNLLAAIWQDSSVSATRRWTPGRFRLERTGRPRNHGGRAAAHQPGGTVVCGRFCRIVADRGRRGPRRRPLWEFEIDTARQQQPVFAPAIIGFGRKPPARPGVRRRLPAVASKTPAYPPPHIRSITMERQQGQHHWMPPPRRNLEITQNLAGGTDNTLASVLDCTVTPGRW
ncbi:hypothetical protein MJ575_23150 [Klebsiella pneumoniae]|nr:hypothetical protein MJ575_23150 [Klebsiella pneumoniae]